MSIETHFIGKLNRDPELVKEIVKGEEMSKAVLNFTVPSLKKDQPPEFMKVTVWGKQAEQICENNQKGSRFSVSGELRSHTYTNKDGIEKKDWYTIPHQIIYLDKKVEKNKETKEEDYEL